VCPTRAHSICPTTQILKFCRLANISVWLPCFVLNNAVNPVEHFRSPSGCYDYLVGLGKRVEGMLVEKEFNTRSQNCVPGSVLSV
jgi:hypothetical protein